MLAKHQLEEMFRYDIIKMTPYDPANLQPASYDLTLHHEFRRSNPLGDRILDCRKIEPGHTRLMSAADDVGSDEYGPYIILSPRDFILATTVEEVLLPGSVSARVEGKSSLGRLGLAVHVTAGFIDPGFHGNITLEIANLGDWVVKLRPGQKIAQIAFSLMSEPVRNQDLYGKQGNHYQGQQGPVESKFEMEPV